MSSLALVRLLQRLNVFNRTLEIEDTGAQDGIHIRLHALRLVLDYCCVRTTTFFLRNIPE